MEDEREAAEKAIDRCIGEGILKDYLTENREVVIGYALRYMRMLTAHEVHNNEIYANGRIAERADDILLLAGSYRKKDGYLSKMDSIRKAAKLLDPEAAIPLDALLSLSEVRSCDIKQ